MGRGRAAGARGPGLGRARPGRAGPGWAAPRDKNPRHAQPQIGIQSRYKIQKETKQTCD
jgi:hypothetical protein